MQEMVSIGDAMKKYFTTWTFQGRASRSEYWWPVLVSVIAGFIPLWGLIYALVALVPSICVGVRRLHDIGKSGWWVWIILIPLVGPILLLVWFCSKSQETENAYGPVPNVK